MLKVVLQKYLDQKVELSVYSSKSRKIRGKPPWEVIGVSSSDTDGMPYPCRSTAACISPKCSQHILVLVF